MPATKYPVRDGADLKNRGGGIGLVAARDIAVAAEKRKPRGLAW